MTNFLTALGFLTKIPISKNISGDDKSLSKSMIYFPVVGFLLGVILVLVDNALAFLLPTGLINLILVFLLLVLTGGIHLDGLADTVDGFCAKTKNKEETLNIMRDSRIGTMGVIAVIALILFEYEALNSISGHFREAALILMCAASRWCQVMVSYFSRYARDGDGLGRLFIGKVGRREFFMAALFIIAASLSVWLVKGLLVVVFVSVLAWGAMKYAHKKIGGMTGDTVGAINELAEAGVLLAVLIIEKAHLWIR